MALATAKWYHRGYRVGWKPCNLQHCLNTARRNTSMKSRREYNDLNENRHNDSSKIGKGNNNNNHNDNALTMFTETRIMCSTILRKNSLRTRSVSSPMD